MQDQTKKTIFDNQEAPPRHGGGSGGGGFDDLKFDMTLFRESMKKLEIEEDRARQIAAEAREAIAATKMFYRSHLRIATIGGDRVYKTRSDTKYHKVENCDCPTCKAYEKNKE